METSHLFDSTRPRYPNQTHFLHLVSIFFDNLACHFPFLDRATVTRQAEEGTLSAILANCIAGLAVRSVHGRFLFALSHFAVFQRHWGLTAILIPSIYLSCPQIF